jgi:ketol-acid reductoisomerase
MASPSQLHVPEYMTGKTVAILGYGSAAKEYANLLREKGISVVIGLRPIDDTWEDAKLDGFPVMTLWDAVESASIIQVW